MKTYIADIIPKIQSFSRKLDDLTNLTNQHWVVLNELSQAKTVYIFRKNGELLISTGGKVEKSKWEYLGQNTILIDLEEQSYLFRHGFFDENILALKIDGREEYAILVNESKYQGELNSISAVTNFLNENYVVNPINPSPQLEQSDSPTKSIVFVGDGFTFKMGSFKEYKLWLTNGQMFKIYKKKSNGKYFTYKGDEILLFSSRESCVRYLEELIW